MFEYVWKKRICVEEIIGFIQENYCEEKELEPLTKDSRP